MKQVTNELLQNAKNAKWACEYLNISRTKLWMLMKKEDLPYLKFGASVYFFKDKIDAWLESKFVNAEQAA